MRQSFVRRAAVAAVVAVAAFALAGCVKLKQKTQVMPDGSGRLTMTIGMSTEMFDEARKKAATDGAAVPEKFEPFKEMRDPADFCEGYVAASPVETYEKEGFTYASFTLWFEDANRLRIRKVGDGAPGSKSGATSEGEMSMRFVKTAAGGTLTVRNGLMGDDASIGGGGAGGGPGGGEMQIPPEMKAQIEEMMKTLFKGFEISETYEVPGDVTSAEGLSDKAGRTASLRVTDADMTDSARFEKFARAKNRTISFGATTVSETDLALFRADMAKAKADFEKRVAAGLAKPAPRSSAKAAGDSGPTPDAKPAAPGADAKPETPPAGDGREKARIRRKGDQ